MPSIAISRTFAAILALVLMASTPHAFGQTSEQASDNDLVLNYYRDPRPERLAGLFDRVGKNPKWDAFPPTVGLFAVVFREHPEWIERLIPANFNARTVDAVEAALQLSGNSAVSARLKSRFDQAGHDATLQRELANLPPQVMDIRITRPTHLDILWGAFFGSGDERYVMRIIDFMAETANHSQAVALDVTKTTVAMSGGPQDIYGELKGTYGGAAFNIIMAATALWALTANAQRHEKVANAMATYISGHRSLPATTVLSAFLKRSKQRP